MKKGTEFIGLNFLSFVSKYGLVFALFIMLTILSVTAEYFLTYSNITNILLQSVNIGIMAAGLTVVIIVAEIDLAVAAIQTLAAVVVAMLLVNYGIPIFPAIVLTLFVGIIAGAFSGVFAGWFAIPAFILTLAMNSLARGTALIITDQNSIWGLPEGFAFIGQGYVGPVPFAVIIMVLVFVVVHVLLTRTSLGTYIYAVGGNIEAARANGINVFLVKVLALTISGFCSALAGIVIASRLMAAQPIMGLWDLMDVIAAVVIGGTSLLGGEGRIIGTVIGTLIIVSMRNGLNLLGISPDWQLIGIGVIIVLAILFDYFGRNKAI
jgi:ribose/xylose/arabinose/galactoside ABC-type transport system permease subunit